MIAGVSFVRSIEMLIGVAIFAICCAELIRQLKHERQKSIDATIEGVIHPLKHILPIFALGVCFLLANFFVALVITPDSTPERPISRQVFNSVFEPIEEGIQLIFSDYDSSSSIGEVRELVVQNVFGGQWFEEEIDESINAVKPPEDTRTLKEYLYDIINSTIRTPLLSFFQYISIFGVIVLFIVLRLLFIVLLWISYLITYVVIKLLLKYGIILMNEQPSTRKCIEFTQ